MCTLEKRGKLYLLTLTGDGDHRLSLTLLDAIRSALARVRYDFATTAASSRGAALITAAEGNFFSNGFDLAWAQVSFAERGPLLASTLASIFSDLMSLPMPTIAAVAGHAAAAGCGLALCHDYVLMRRDRGFLCMNEVDLGISFSSCFMALMRAKIAHPWARRDMLLRAVKVTAARGVEMGIVARAIGGGAEETVAAALQLGVELAGRNCDGEVYASIRKAMLPELSESLGLIVPTDNFVIKARI